MSLAVDKCFQMLFFLSFSPFLVFLVCTDSHVRLFTCLCNVEVFCLLLAVVDIFLLSYCFPDKRELLMFVFVFLMCVEINNSC